jgi:predicted RNA polymerase sigma factor
VPPVAQIRTIQAKGDSSSMNESATHSAIETVVRQSHGQIIAYLAARSGDVAGAEDALSDAFLAALRRWPVDGVPDKPEAWLLRAARNRLIDSARHDQVRLRSSEYLQQIAEAAIQSVHARRASSGETDWQAIALLYEGLARIAPGIGALVGRAVALGQAGDPGAGLDSLDNIPSDRIATYQPYWAARGQPASFVGRHQ